MKKQKAAALAAALTLAGSILFTGTFAWRSMSQEARNELVRTANPGARLHDDFDGTSKDVYAENFFTANEGGRRVFVRIRLDEYMEVGPDAGAKLDDPARRATSLVPGAKIGDVTTWTPHIPADDDPALGGEGDPFQAYWGWTMGGGTVYMPTFNKNRDSLQADVNGAWNGTRVDGCDTYKVKDKETDFAVYDADDNDVEDDAVTLLEETHEAKETRSATVVTMAKWKELGSPVGDYWVYDADGWAYWARALDPGDTTGLLLDRIDYVSADDAGCYYGINVVAQFATAEDLGSPDGGAEGTGDGFYDPTKGGAPSPDAQLLLEKVTALAPPAETPGEEPEP